MTREETLARLRDIEQRVRELRAATDVPALERTLQMFDTYCHIARWELGDIAALTPESEAAAR